MCYVYTLHPSLTLSVPSLSDGGATGLPSGLPTGLAAPAASLGLTGSAEHLSSRLVYHYSSQRLSSEQHVFMQRVVNECYLRTKNDPRPIVDPNHLIYQFSRKFYRSICRIAVPSPCVCTTYL